MGRFFDVSNIADFDFTEGYTGIQVNGGGSVIIGLTTKLNAAEGSAGVGYHPARLGNKQGQLPKGTTQIQFTPICDLNALGQIQSQFTETDSGLSGGNPGEGNHISVLAKTYAAVKMLPVFGHTALCFFVFATLMVESEFGLFRFAQRVE